MSSNKTIIFLGDGMADEPVPELEGKTPLQQANTPAMDSIAKDGRSGTMLTLPDDFPTSSEVANMSVLGCDLPTEYCGRGPLEAAGRNIDLGPDDKAFRMNLISIEDGILSDFSGGHIDQASSEILIEALNNEFGTDKIKICSGVSYRNLLILSGKDFSHKLKTDKPDDNHGNPINEHLPIAISPEAKPTEEFLHKLVNEAGIFLNNHPVNIERVANGLKPANGVWPWSGGSIGALKTLHEKYNISGAVISAVDVINGLGKCLGMEVIDVPGATGYIDTNYEGKAHAAIEAIKNHDFVYLHLEAIDEVSHEQNLEYKIKAIEDFDSRIIAPVLSAIGNDVNVAVLPDHPVPITLGKHTRTPVPVSVRMSGAEPDSVEAFDEASCMQGSLGELKNDQLMNILLT